MNVKTISSLSKEQPDCHYVANWPDKNGCVPIYHANTSHAFNRLVGYARFINAGFGTVLYRGQTKIYKSLSPSGARVGHVAVSEDEITRFCSDNELLAFFNLDNPEIEGWNKYRHLLVESVLQHYGAQTYCMDFVDNHWCALWFGLYEFENGHYHKRTDDGNLYVFLYVADTVVPCIRGVYIGEDSYTVDLRKALPSTFQRPASQHGWIVRKKERVGEAFDKYVIGIIEVSVKDATQWLGDGYLLSEDNFFPSFTIDQGYKVLLSRQERSGIDQNREKVLSQNIVCNYHYSDMYYVSNKSKILIPKKKIPFIGENDSYILQGLFSVLLNYGWEKETCASEDLWDENKPYKAQSASTALLLKKYFRGKICAFKYSGRNHFYNIIDGVIVDLTYYELQQRDRDYYETVNEAILSKNAISKAEKKFATQVSALLENCMKSQTTFKG